MPSVLCQEPPREQQKTEQVRDTNQERRLDIPPQEPTQSIPLVDAPVSPQKPRFTWDSWASGLEINCLACGVVAPSTALPTPANANSPWAVQGTVRREGAFGSVSGGILGVRNYARPLYSATPIGGMFNPGIADTTTANAFVPSAQWHLTAAYTRRLGMTSAGATFDFTADVFVPLKIDELSGDPMRLDALPSRAIRLGLAIRW